jgi:hypothetical protein
MLTLPVVHALASITQLASVVAFLILYAHAGSPDATALVYAHYTRWEPPANHSGCEDYKCRVIDTSTPITVNLLALVCFFTAWSGLCHAVATARSPRLLRVLDYAVSAPVMLIVVSLTCGVSDLGQIVLSATLMAAIVLADYLAEGLPGQTYMFVATAVPYSIMWSMIWVSFAYAASTLAPPSFVYVIVAATMFMFSSFAGLRLYTLFVPVAPARTEALYAILSLTAKVQLSWLFFVGVVADRTVSNNSLTPVDTRTDDALIVFAATTSVGILLAAVVNRFLWD